MINRSFFYHSLSFFLCFVFLNIPSNDLKAIDVPKLTRQVTDNAGVLSAETVAKLEIKLKSFEETTSNQIAVLTIPSLEGDTIEGAAIQVFDAWKLGQKDKDNGVLLIISIQDRKMRIEVGRGLEGALTDVLSDHILRNEIRPKFKANDMNGGVEAGVDAIIKTIAGEYTPSESDVKTTTTSSGEEGTPPIVLIGIGILLLAFGLYSSIFNSLLLLIFGIPVMFSGLTGFLEDGVATLISIGIIILYIILRIVMGIFGLVGKSSRGGGSWYGGGGSDSFWSSSGSDDSSWFGGGGDSAGGGSSGDW
ncbi:TPM domain-containing protein [Leptospira idonii]|uniref:YgcG family protein n=1 Tax=Leptospira idonii TaxID=1193500 RepID=A0A4R9M4W4_9LEPT|nr:YgcG family protein [Leptospira idonii]TGN21001.1 YgcG family protein [Leptospira idonii]